jgi:hypothetical protein
MRIKMIASMGTVASDGQKNKELNESHSDRSAEVTVLPPSFFIGIKT